MAALEDNDKRHCGTTCGEHQHVRAWVATRSQARASAFPPGPFSEAFVWPCLAPAEDGIPADDIAERRAGEYIGRKMRLQCDP